MAVAGSSALGTLALGHSGASIESGWASTIPEIDGAWSTGEWEDAATVDLDAIPRNGLPAVLLVKNNDTFLWIAYDVFGDTTADLTDAASLSFHTDHDGAGTVGREDAFLLRPDIFGGGAHFVFNGVSWDLHDTPFNGDLPGHRGLAAAVGFVGSDSAHATPHRIYEFRVPLALLGASEGTTIGLFGGSGEGPGVFDASGARESTWPVSAARPLPFRDYGDLSLDIAPSVVGATISPSNTLARGIPGEVVWHNLTVRNRGTVGGDTFDVAATSVWPLTLWDSSGTTPLADTDSDGVADTGTVASGDSVRIIAKVTVAG